MLLHFQRNTQLKRFLLHLKIAQHCRSTVKRRIGVQTGTKADGTPAIQEVELTFIPEGDIYRLAARSKLPGADEMDEVSSNPRGPHSK